jgi:hypothetical protein
MPSIRDFTAVVLAAASLALFPHGASSQQHCSPSRLPLELPAVDAVVDSAAITALIAGSGAAGVLRFSIVADAGDVPKVYPIGGVAASPASEWLTPRIEASLRAARKSSTPWGVRLMASADSVPVIALERSEYCRPQPMPSATRSTIRIVRRADSPPPEISPYTVRITSGGSVHGVTFLRSSDRDIESQIRRIAGGIRYHPARIDGVPVASVDTIGRR